MDFGGIKINARRHFNGREVRISGNADIHLRMSWCTSHLFSLDIALILGAITVILVRKRCFFHPLSSYLAPDCQLQKDFRYLIYALRCTYVPQNQ